MSGSLFLYREAGNIEACPKIVAKDVDDIG
jgi:hypothetical protein